MANYDDGVLNAVANYIGANAVRYGSLLYGIANMVGDDPDLGKVALGGLGFLVGTIWDKAITRRQSIIELKALESKLEEKK